METKTPLNAQIRNRGLAGGRQTAPLMISRPAHTVATDPAIAGNGWQSAGIVDQMLAYRDWWNLPVRRQQGASRS